MGSSVAYRQPSMITECGTSFVMPSDYSRFQPSDRGLGNPATTRHDSFLLSSTAKRWIRNYWQPYKGITSDGVVHPVWQANQSVKGPTEQMVFAAKRLLAGASYTERQRFRYLVTAREWRAWSDPDVVAIDSGILVEEMSETTKSAISDLLEVTISPEGFEKIKSALAPAPSSSDDMDFDDMFHEPTSTYKFCLFGEPSMDAPWGFNLYGRNICLNVFTLSGELIIGPFSVNVEARDVDQGSQLLRRGELAGLKLMQSLSPQQQSTASLQYTVDDLDGSSFIRTVGGPHQDNVTIPYRGICASKLSGEQTQLLLEVVRSFNEMLPKTALDSLMTRVEEHLDETFFAWSGLVADDSPYYFRVHSPVVLDELDHQEVESLTQYRVIATQRLPNRGDYGAALLDEWIRHSHAKVRKSF